jgi:hypothetical protein
MDCATLRSEKWKSCHPTGDSKVGHERCVQGMSKEKLTELYNAHNECLSYRVLENNSSCFSKKDKGHKKAELVEEQETMICLHLLNDYKEKEKEKEKENDTESESDYNESEYDKNQIEYDTIDEIDPPVKASQLHSREGEYEDEEEYETPSLLSNILYFGKWILFIVAIITLLYFIIYIT